MSESHVVGISVETRGIRRQRCAWCGALLQEDDLSRMAWALNEDGSDPGPPSEWPVAEILRIDGNVLRVVPKDEWPEEGKVPLDCCLRIDPQVTT